MRKIAVFTGGRADYGLLYHLLQGIQNSEQLELQLIVGGYHWSSQFGETWKQVKADGFEIAGKIESVPEEDTALGIVNAVAKSVQDSGAVLSTLNPSCLVILGDRFETFAIAQAAMFLSIPLVHLHGGEITEGAYDDDIRHALTKLSSLHCVATEEYKNRVIQMGESPSNVFAVGALGIEQIHQRQKLAFNDVAETLGIDQTRPYFLITYHPVTRGDEPPKQVFQQLMEALLSFEQHQLIVTYPNADNGGQGIIDAIDTYQQRLPKTVFAHQSLGTQRYLCLAEHADAVVGNSSSGIIEIPSLKVPSVNVGVRQQGRLCADSVIHTAADCEGIIKALDKALSDEFKVAIQATKNPYDGGSPAAKIVQLLEKGHYSNATSFYDLPYQVNSKVSR